MNDYVMLLILTILSIALVLIQVKSIIAIREEEYSIKELLITIGISIAIYSNYLLKTNEIFIVLGFILFILIKGSRNSIELRKSTCVTSLILLSYISMNYVNTHYSKIGFVIIFNIALAMLYRYKASKILIYKNIYSLIILLTLFNHQLVNVFAVFVSFSIFEMLIYKKSKKIMELSYKSLDFYTTRLMQLSLIVFIVGIYLK